MLEYDNNKTHVPQVMTAVNTPTAANRHSATESQSTEKGGWHKRRIAPCRHRRWCSYTKALLSFATPQQRLGVGKHSINIPANHKVFITQWTPRFGLMDNFHNSRLPVTKRPSNHTGFLALSHSCEKLLLVSTLTLWTNKCTLSKHVLTFIIRTRFEGGT